MPFLACLAFSLASVWNIWKLPAEGSSTSCLDSSPVLPGLGQKATSVSWCGCGRQVDVLMTCAVCGGLTEGLMWQGRLESLAVSADFLQGTQVEGGDVLDDPDPPSFLPRGRVPGCGSDEH